MKWPLTITLVRHGQSRYNALRTLKQNDQSYRLFKKAFAKDPASRECRALAEIVRDTFALGASDYETDLTPAGQEQGYRTGKKIQHCIPLPDVVVISPYLRTRQTFRSMADGWPELEKGPLVYPDDRVREQEHGLSLLYNDWRVFHAFHPDQRMLYKLMGPYWYQYPQGESVAQVRDRVRAITNTIVREWAGKHVMIITHHLTILSIRANFERLSPEQFVSLDENDKPRNCGVTIYKGYPDEGKDGRLRLEYYNRCFWEE